jgi:DNA-binding NarL/FixJ family response regulator
LTPEDRGVYARLSVFTAGFTLEGVAAVATDDETEALDVVGRLIDASLVQVVDGAEEDRPRYAMLETVREYAAELLAAGDEAGDVHARLVRMLVDLNRWAYASLTGTERTAWQARLRAELPNIRTAVAWALENEDAEAALQLTIGAVWFLWNMQGLSSDEAGLLERALNLAASAPGRVDPAVLGRGLTALGMHLYVIGDFPQARARLEEAAAAARSAGDAAGLSSALTNQANVSTSLHEYAQARVLLEEVVAIRRGLDMPRLLIAPLYNLGSTYLEEGRLADALVPLDEAWALAERHGEERDRAYARFFKGELAVQAGRFDEARNLLLDARRRLALAGGDVRGSAAAAVYLALAEHLAGRPEDALPLAAEALSSAVELGDRIVGGAAIDVLAAVLAALGRAQPAALLIGAARQRREAASGRIRPSDRAWIERSVATARTALGHEAFAAAVTSGRWLDFAQALAIVEEILQDPDFAVRGEGAGRAQLSSTRPAGTASTSAVAELSPREHDVLALLANGLTDREIGEELSISVRTVSNHVGRILAKLDAPTRTAAVALALREGIA